MSMIGVPFNGGDIASGPLRAAAVEVAAGIADLVRKSPSEDLVRTLSSTAGDLEHFVLQGGAPGPAQEAATQAWQGVASAVREIRSAGGDRQVAQDALDGVLVHLQPYMALPAAETAALRAGKDATIATIEHVLSGVFDHGSINDAQMNLFREAATGIAKRADDPTSRVVASGRENLWSMLRQRSPFEPENLPWNPLTGPQRVALEDALAALKKQ